MKPTPGPKPVQVAQPAIKPVPLPPVDTKKPEALIQVSKQKAVMLLSGLEHIVNKNDPIYIELTKELNEVIKYWTLVETVEIKKSKNAMDQLRQKRTLTGEAAKKYIQRKNSR